jgi:hypothetical protein
MMARYSPPPPGDVSPPVLWGDPAVVRERLGAAVKDLTFARDAMFFPTLSVQHYRQFMETNFGPARKLLNALDTADPAKAAALRSEIEEIAGQYFSDNIMRQDYLMTRAIKV